MLSLVSRTLSTPGLVLLADTEAAHGVWGTIQNIDVLAANCHLYAVYI